MTRWQPPYPHDPQKAVTRCCWPACRKPSNYGATVPMCSDHVAEAWYVYDKQLRRDLGVITERKAARALLDEQQAKKTAEMWGTASHQLKPKEGTIYYLQVGAHIKIGYTADLTKRIRAYPPDSKVLGIEWGGKDLEKQRHQQFDAHRALGREWFVDTPEIREHIETNCLKWYAQTVAASGPSGPTRAPMKIRYRAGMRSGRIVG